MIKDPGAGNRLEVLLDLYNLFPFEHHPLWKSVIGNKLTKQQIVLAECQHYLRTKEGQKLRKSAMEQCISISSILWEAIIETYIEECTDEDGTESHLDLIKRFITENGVEEESLNGLKHTPGNISAISLYKDISERGAGCHIIGAGIVENFYSKLSPKIFEAYVSNYGFSENACETYRLHGPMDETHAQRAFSVIDTSVDIHGWDTIYFSVRDAFVATSLHYDGMLQNALKTNNYWNGKF